MHERSSSTTTAGHSRFKIFADPVHGFISVPRDLILDLIQSHAFQRLRRIRQLGVGNYVFPGGEHTRFAHALGAMALMQDTLKTLSEKGTPILPNEHQAALIVALLHDLGHGPFSHTLEHELIQDFHHERMSRALMEDLNTQFDGALSLALAIFDNTYERPFFHQLISSQLDMDRLDYLRRDSFYTGVAEGEVGVQRIIKTLRVHPPPGGRDSRVVIEAKGMYAVENYLFARRLMYWQVYLHKTVLAGDRMLSQIFRRARALIKAGSAITEQRCAPALLFFLNRSIKGDDIEQQEVREMFCQVDDTDVIFTLKQWMEDPDLILADLSKRFINRHFLRVHFLPGPLEEDMRIELLNQIARLLVDRNLTTPDQAEYDAGYYFSHDLSSHFAYEDVEDSIEVLDAAGQVREISTMTDTGAIGALTRFVQKPYICIPKALNVDFLQHEHSASPEPE